MTNKIVKLYLNTEDRLSGSIDDCFVSIGQPIPNVKKIEVDSIILPLLMYNITTKNNQFRFIDSGANDFTVNFTEGSYSAQSFASEMETLMNATSGDTFVVTYNPITFKFVFSTTAGAWSIEDVGTAFEVYNSIGITEGTASTLIGADHTITSSVVAFGLPYHMYLESLVLSQHNNLFSQHYYSSNTSEDGKNIIQKIDLTTNTGGVVFQQKFTEENVSDIGQESGGLNALPQKIDLKLRFPNNQPVDILSDYSVEIHIHTVQ